MARANLQAGQGMTLCMEVAVVGAGRAQRASVRHASVQVPTFTDATLMPRRRAAQARQRRAGSQAAQARVACTFSISLRAASSLFSDCSSVARHRPAWQ